MLHDLHNSSLVTLAPWGTHTNQAQIPISCGRRLVFALDPTNQHLRMAYGGADLSGQCTGLRPRDPWFVGTATGLPRIFGRFCRDCQVAFGSIFRGPGFFRPSIQYSVGGNRISHYLALSLFVSTNFPRLNFGVEARKVISH